MAKLSPILWLFGGAVAGYAYAKYTSPIPIPCEQPGSRPVTQSAARALLTVGDVVDDIRPALRAMSEGEVPSPQELVQVANYLRS